MSGIYPRLSVSFALLKGGMVATPTAQQIRVTSFVGIPIAILATWFRLYLRTSRRTLWWDDFFAFVSMVGICFLWTGILIFTDSPDNHSRRVKVIGYYCVDNGFYATIWPARCSILLTIIRMSYGKFRKLLTYTVGAFLVTWVILDAQVWWTCEGEVGWKKERIAQCMLGKDVAIAQLVTDCVSDLILIVAPIYLLSTLTSRRTLKIRLIAIFSSTIFTTIFSLVHAYAILHDLGYLEFMFAVIEMVVSLLVVNLSVITSWFFKLKEHEESTENSGPSYINTFLKGRLSGRGSKNHENTTMIGLPTMAPSRINIGITRVVDIDTAIDDRGRVGFADGAVSSERIDEESGSMTSHGSMAKGKREW
ncbi:hypothetical protein VKT23_016482 [Stygiomarasmius scandens]|uniref:Rhodopsin domain-containing protein n=1 Tax=Marasmiellus scandens TaxID=2682957 RepID=A0ABR1IV74_9AGAR